MNNFTKKDLKNRLKLDFSETKLYILKFILKNLSLPSLLRLNAAFLLGLLPFWGFQCFVMHRCILTSHKKFLNRFFKLSRFAYLKYIRFGFFYGFSKASW